MKTSYSQAELDAIRSRVAPREGWDFSRMRDERAPVPWDYLDIVTDHLSPDADVLDVGTGGGEILRSFASRIGTGLGVDVDPQMVSAAAANSRGAENLAFRLGSHLLDEVSGRFDLILDRHAPFALHAVRDRLVDGGVFITQQVGERNMANVKRALGQEIPGPPISRSTFDGIGLTLIDFCEYDVEYVVRDIDSLVFWLRALDFLHADVDGSRATDDAEALNAILEGAVTDRGFVTNEHRYLAVARLATT